MDYKEKYQEALERAKKGLPLDEVFPELKEGEDERIREILINIVKGACSKYGIKHICDEISEEKLLAYLERWKENPKSADSIPSDCVSDAKCEDRWHKVTDSLPDNGRLVLAKDCLGNVLLARFDGENWEVNVYDNEDHYCHNSISNWCEIPSERQKEPKPVPKFSVGDHVIDTNYKGDPLYQIVGIDKECYICEYRGDKEMGDRAVMHFAFDNPYLRLKQKPAEWSEKDKERLESIIAFLTFENENRGFIGQGGFTAGDLIHWLKYLPERFNIQPKQEWSEEDEERIKSIKA